MKFEQKISVIIPAYNEAANIESVLKKVVDLEWVDEVIVVDDGSTDRTSEITKEYKNLKTRLIIHKSNCGKGAAMASGIRAAKYDLILFLDADLIGLRESHLLEIIAPIVFCKTADLSLGVFGLNKMSKSMSTKISNRMIPSITGQRAIWRKSLPPLSRIQRSRFGVDLLMTRHVPRNRRAIVKLKGLSQVTKEQKSGGDLMKAMALRLKMYQEVMKIMKK